MTDAQQPIATGPMLDYLEALLRRHLADEQARQERILELEKAGHRIIEGGQTGRSDDDVATWEIKDWRTGEIIEAGTGEYDAYEAALERLDPDNQWWLVENVTVDDDAPGVPHDGLPASLAESLQDWLGWSMTSDEDVAAVVGWSVAEVRRHRAES